MKKILRIIAALTITSFMVACGTYEKAVKVDPTTNYFPARKNKQVNVTIDNPFENK